MNTENWRLETGYCGGIAAATALPETGLYPCSMTARPAVGPYHCALNLWIHSCPFVKFVVY